ncbi:hypothetical protein DVA85_29085, partial [Acinetobacter sp. RIT592]
MNSIIKNEFITTKKGTLILANILIIAATALAYFAITKASKAEVLSESQIMSMFAQSTINVIPPFIVILISKAI